MAADDDGRADSGGAGGGDDHHHHRSCLFGKYEVGRLLGCGAFAKVYHARDARSGRNVAIKAVSKHKVVVGNMAALVKREISIMRRLRHPNIVRLLEVLATKTKIYFVMEFAKGGELFAKVARGRFSEDLSRRYFQQLISAVRCCHSRGVYHRDLKPENLLLDEDWNLKVTYFGLRAATDQVRADGLLHTLCGTPAYVAPEVLAKKGYDGARVDIWSCGVVLYVLNAGYLPFNDANLMAMYRKIYKAEFRCPKWTSPELKNLLARLLDANPDTRIRVDEILNHPWFNKGSKPAAFLHHIHMGQYYRLEDDEELDDCFDADNQIMGPKESAYPMNAFDIISLSSGFDLSGMFWINGGGAVINGEKFVCEAEAPETILERVEEVGKEEGVKVTRNKGLRVRLEGQDGNFDASLELRRLTDKLVLVEVKVVGCSRDDLWTDRFRPRLLEFVHQPDAQVACN